MAPVKSLVAITLLLLLTLVCCSDVVLTKLLDAALRDDLNAQLGSSSLVSASYQITAPKESSDQGIVEFTSPFVILPDSRFFLFVVLISLSVVQFCQPSFVVDHCGSEDMYTQRSDILRN